MPIPVRVRPAPPVVVTTRPPVPEVWGSTGVSVAGSNGHGEEISLTAFDGREWPAILLQPGATGLDMPPFALFSDDSPNLDGAIFRSSRAAAREILLPVYLHGVDRRTVNALKRMLFRALNPKRGYCVLRFTEGNGEARQLNAYYKGGMEGDEGETSGFSWARYGLTFSAMDPWFYPEHPERIRWAFGGGLPLLSPTAKFFPMRVTDGVLGGPGERLLISNPGDVDAWPVWRLYGPIKSFALTSAAGDSVKASAPPDGSDIVPAGRVLTIDTRPGRKSVKDDRGTNHWARLDTSPRFWPIDPGDTQSSVSVVTGIGKASVLLEFRPRYASFV
ncbi:phage tail domain-containing protein [Streptomyces sp. NPDC005955]|uniref:phage tail domain-containing protein n=1 Tax=Streptomyces sp. NPDC005955 TaxID=3364738 RepID=UPI0036834F2B